MKYNIRNKICSCEVNRYEFRAQNLCGVVVGGIFLGL